MTTTAKKVAGAKAARKIAGVMPLPVGKPVSLPHKPKPARKVPPIPLSAAIAAATRNGGMVLNVSNLKNEALLGKFIEQAGARDLGRYRIAISSARIDDVDRVLTVLDGQAEQMPGSAAILTRLEIQKTRIEAINVGAKVGMALLETEEVPEPQGVRPPVMPGFGPSMPVQINVSGGATVSAVPPSAP